MPVRATVCGLPATLLVTVSVADLLPVEAGENVTETTVFCPAGTVMGSVAEVKLNSEALVPPSVIAVIVRSAVPLLVMVRFVGVLLVPEIWLPNGMLVGAKVIPGATPVPLRLAECGLPAELSAIDNAAVLLPVEVGENVTFTVVVLPGATVIGSVPAVNVN